LHQVVFVYTDKKAHNWLLAVGERAG